MNDPPALRRDTDRRAGQQFPRHAQASGRFRRRSQDRSRAAMTGCSIARQGFQRAPCRFDHAGIGRAPDANLPGSSPTPRQSPATWLRNSPAFSFETLAIAPRQPGVRSGPTRWPSARTAQTALLEFFRAMQSADSCEPQPARRKILREIGERHRLPRQRMPGRNLQRRRSPISPARQQDRPAPGQGAPGRAPWPSRPVAAPAIAPLALTGSRGARHSGLYRASAMSRPRLRR